MFHILRVILHMNVWKELDVVRGLNQMLQTFWFFKG